MKERKGKERKVNEGASHTFDESRFMVTVYSTPAKRHWSFHFHFHFHFYFYLSFTYVRTWPNSRSESKMDRRIEARISWS